MDDKKFAILIDADNTSSKYIKTIIDEVTNEGSATYKRIYGDWTSALLKNWKEMLLEYSITPMHQYSYTYGKNSTDSAMIIDAMDILYSDKVDGFCIVSSDCDFTRLATRLREAGKIVIGMGREQTPQPFVKACNKFKYLDVLSSEEEKTSLANTEEIESTTSTSKQSNDTSANKQASTPLKKGTNKKQQLNKTIDKKVEIIPASNVGLIASKPTKVSKLKQSGKKDTPSSLTPLKEIIKAITVIIDKNSDDDGWMLASHIKTLLTNKFSDFDCRNYNKCKKFTELFGISEFKQNYITEKRKNTNNIQNPNSFDFFVKNKK